MPPATARPPLPAFKLERFFARHEFSAPHLLCCSDCEPLTMTEVLELADAETLAMWNGLRLSYTDTAGLPALREEICRQYTSLGPEDLTVLAPEEGVYLSMQALLSPGDHVVCMFPGYQSLYAIAQSMGCTLTMWEPELADGSFSFKVSTLLNILRQAAHAGDHAKLVVVNFPHNPTGQLPSQQEWLQLVGACREHEAFLFSDEMYRGLELDPADRLPAAADLYPRAISLCGVSKRLGLPGLRIGWLASKASLPSPAAGGQATEDMPFQLRVRELKDYTTICSSAPSEVLSLIALRAIDAITDRHLSTIRQNLALVTAFFQEFSGMLEWLPPRAGSIAFPRITTGQDVEQFCDAVVAGCGVLLLPAAVYDHAGSTARGHFRLGLGRRDLPQCLGHLRGYLQASAAAHQPGPA